MKTFSLFTLSLSNQRMDLEDAKKRGGHLAQFAADDRLPGYWKSSRLTTWTAPIPHIVPH
jgi:hypothetical protein